MTTPGHEHPPAGAGGAHNPHAATAVDPYTGKPVHAAAHAPHGGVVHGQPVLAHHGHDPHAAHHVPTATEAPKAEEGYRDVAFLIAFVIHLLVILIIAFAMGIPALNAAASEEQNPAGHTVSPTVANESSIVGMLVVAALVGGATSMLWLAFLQRNAASIITCALWTSVVVQAVGAVIAFFFSPFMGVILLILAALCACYARAVANRIPFASENLKVATAAVRMYPATVGLAFLAILVQLVWVVVWALAFYGVQAESEGDGNLAEVFMLLSLFWGQQVIQNIVHCTIAGTVGSWWFAGDTVAKPTWGALKRSCTTSLGSIAFGSLIVAIIKTLRALARNAENEARKRGGAGAAFVLCFVRCMLDCLERLVEYFNKWAFCYVGIYGKDFRSAGSAVFALFRDRGWTTVINDDLIGTALSIGCLVVGVGTGIIGAIWAVGTDPNATGSWIFASAFISLIIGFMMCAIVSTVITSSVATVFVCWAENPEALGHTHPEHLESLLNAWRTFHPAEMEACGYNARFGAPSAV